MASTEEQAQELYEELKPQAVLAYLGYLSSHTPPELQADMKEIAQADLAGSGGSDLTDSQVILNSGDSVRVVMAAGGDAPGSPGAAAVSSGTLDFVQLQSVTGQSQDQSRRQPQPQRQTTPRR